MREGRPIVYIVDDEPSVCVSLQRLLRSIGLEAQTFMSAEEFLQNARRDVLACLVLDVRLPDLSGLELQVELNEAKVDIPVVFISGHADIAMSVRAMKAGAVEFLTKPFREQELLEAIQRAIKRHRRTREKLFEAAEIQRRYTSLTHREQEVLTLVVAGLRNKRIAVKLATTEKTIKVHRGRMMRKMKAESLAHLIHIAGQIGIDLTKVLRR